MSTAAYTLGLAVFDSCSTAQQIIIFVLLLTTAKPLRNSLTYLAGLSGAYFVCGLGGYLGFARLQLFLAKYFPSSAGLPDRLYYQTELVSGLGMGLIGWWYYRRYRHAAPSRSQNNLVARFKSMNPGFAGGLGALISATSFPVAIPYLLALGKYATLDLPTPAAAGYILLYNLGYALPMLLVLAVYGLARRRRTDLEAALPERSRVLNVQLTAGAWAGLGLLSMLDALWFFAAGHALLKGRFF